MVTGYELLQTLQSSSRETKQLSLTQLGDN